MKAALQRLLLFVYALSGSAMAAVPAECVPPATPSVGTGPDLDLTSFLPNAPCLMAYNVYSWGQWGLFKTVASVSLILIAAFFFYKLALFIREGAIDKAIVPLAIAIVLGMFIAPARTGDGVIPMIQGEALNAMPTMYTASAAIGNSALANGPQSVSAKTKELAENMALLISRATQAQDIRTQLQAIKAGKATGDLNDPNLAYNLYAQKISEQNAASDGMFGDANSWIFNVGYLMIYGLFTLFAGITFGVVFVMQVLILLLPVGLAFLVFMNFTPLRLIGSTYAATLFIIALLPIAVASVATVGLSIPTEVLSPKVTNANAAITTSLTNYQQLVKNGCGTFDVACSMDEMVLQPMIQDLAAFKELFMNFLISIAALIVGLSISSSTLRRLPATISNFFGAPGGGESSGVTTNPFGRIAEMAGVTAMANMVSSQLQRGALSRVTGQSGGANAGSGAKASGESSATVPSPTPSAEVTSGSGGAGESNSVHVPPPEVTDSGPQSPVGAAYDTYREQRDSGASRLSALKSADQSFTQGQRAQFQDTWQARGAEMREAGSARAEQVKTRAAEVLWGKDNAASSSAKVSAVRQDLQRIRTQRQAAGAASRNQGPSPSGPLAPDDAELHQTPRAPQMPSENTVVTSTGGGANAASISRARMGATLPNQPVRPTGQVQDGQTLRESGAPLDPPKLSPAPAPVPTPAPAPAPAPFQSGATVQGPAAPRRTGVSSSPDAPQGVQAIRPAPAPAPAPVAPAQASGPARQVAELQNRQTQPTPSPDFTAPPSRNVSAFRRSGEVAQVGISLPRSQPSPASQAVPTESPSAAPLPSPAPRPATPSPAPAPKVTPAPAAAPAPAPAATRPSPSTEKNKTP